MKKGVIFPLRITPELHEQIVEASFAGKKSKHQFCIDAIKKSLNNTPPNQTGVTKGGQDARED